MWVNSYLLVKMHSASVSLYLGSGIDAMAQSAQTQPVSKLVCTIRIVIVIHLTTNKVLTPDC